MAYTLLLEIPFLPPNSHSYATLLQHLKIPLRNFSDSMILSGVAWLQRIAAKPRSFSKE